MPTFGNIKITPMTIIDFIAFVQKQHYVRSWTKGEAIYNYVEYLDYNAKEQLHHYGSYKSQGDWLAAAIDQYIEEK